MFILRLLGGATLEGDNGVLLTGRVAQRHRLALLALLGLASARVLSRDKLVAYLWPESDAERARHLLAESVYVLRKALGDAAVISAGDDLRLDATVVRSDVVEFEEAIRGGQPEQAVPLYRGSFLDGFHLSDAPEFERWMEGERTRLEARFRATVEALARGADARGDYRAAVEWWRRLTLLDPLDSRSALGFMSALAASGDPARALQHARIHETLLREELGAAPDSAIAALVEQLRTGRGSVLTQAGTFPAVMGHVAAAGPVAEKRDGERPPDRTATRPRPDLHGPVSPASTGPAPRPVARSAPWRLFTSSSALVPTTPAAKSAPWRLLTESGYQRLNGAVIARARRAARLWNVAALLGGLALLLLLGWAAVSLL